MIKFQGYNRQKGVTIVSSTLYFTDYTNPHLQAGDDYLPVDFNSLKVFMDGCWYRMAAPPEVTGFVPLKNEGKYYFTAEDKRHYQGEWFLGQSVKWENGQWYISNPCLPAYKWLAAINESIGIVVTLDVDDNKLIKVVDL